MLFQKTEDQRQSEFVNKLQQDYTRLFVEIARALTSSLQLAGVLTTLMETMSEYFTPDRWSLLMVDTDTKELYYAVSFGKSSHELPTMRVQWGEGIAGWVAMSSTPVIIPDATVDPRFVDYSRRVLGMEITSLICAPVKTEAGVVGVIQLINPRVDLLSQFSVEFLSVLCDFSAVAIRNATDMARIHELSITDDCTGLFNARHMYELLGEQLEQHAERQLSLIFLDLDRFKRINDIHGHLVGSRVLNEVGTLVKKTMGNTQPAFRYGGDEFVVMLPGQNKQQSTETAKQLYWALRNSKILGSGTTVLNMRASFGVATYPADGRTLDDIIKAADGMMYEAKAASRDNIAVAGRGLVFPAGEGDIKTRVELETRRLETVER